MVQLRDVKTSELIAEGEAYELVCLADHLGREEVLFDDVGAAFDPDAVMAVREAEIDGFKSAAKDSEGDEAKALRERAKALEAGPSGTDKRSASKALKEAREQAGG
jgi:hypothetical protein